MMIEQWDFALNKMWYTSHKALEVGDGQDDVASEGHYTTGNCHSDLDLHRILVHFSEVRV